MAPSVAKAIAAARTKLGARYVWGAAGPSTFDCSGLTSWAWRQAGVTIPRTSQAQATYGDPVKMQDIRAGDLVTSNWGSGPSSHVGLYIGGGKIIHAPRPGSVVKIANLDANYRSKVNAIRRVRGSSAAGVTDVGFGPDDLLEGLGRGITGGLIGDPTDPSSLGSSLLGPLKAIANGTVAIAGSIAQMGGLATLLLKLALPSTWIRIVAGLLGLMFLLLGLGFLIRETRVS